MFSTEYSRQSDIYDLEIKSNYIYTIMTYKERFPVDRQLPAMTQITDLITMLISAQSSLLSPIRFAGW